MQLFQFGLLIFGIINTIAYKNINLHNKITTIKSNLAISNNNQTFIKNIFYHPKKIQSLFKLVRSNNIIPTTLLCFSGGWIINPSIYNLLNSNTFIVSILITVLIMSASMVINDIYDIEIDKINSPNRPLVNGEVKISEAFVLFLLLIGTSEYLSIFYLTDNLKFFIQLAIIQIIFYTPILKRIVIIKNISCAAMVSFSLFFSGLASSKTIIGSNQNLGLLCVAISVIFFGSWCNELLLDIQDREGDINNKIITIPTLIGNKYSWLCSKYILNFNIITNTIIIDNLYNNQVAIFLPIIFSPLIMNLYKIKKDCYSKESIANYMKYSNYPLFLLLIYLCVIARFFS
jgi:geranylgeranylglycerol-phosphate geranylgeranyltransferase